MTISVDKINVSHSVIAIKEVFLCANTLQNVFPQNISFYTLNKSRYPNASSKKYKPFLDGSILNMCLHVHVECAFLT